MYYFYETILDGGIFLHKTQNKLFAEDKGKVIAQVETLKDAQDFYYNIMREQRDRYVNHNTGRDTMIRRAQEENRKSRIIVCLETGEEYKNQSVLSEAIGCTKQNVSLAIKYNRPIKGLTYMKKCDVEEFLNEGVTGVESNIGV